MSGLGARLLLASACLATGLVTVAQDPVVTGELRSGRTGPTPAALAAPRLPVVAPAPEPAPTGRTRAVPAPPASPVVRQRGDGTLRRVSAPALSQQPRPAARRYTVAVEGGLGIDPSQFARTVELVLTDRRSWRRTGAPMLRVDDGPVDFRVVLASPLTTDRLCAPLRTHGRYSCASGSTAVVNSMRWLTGAPAYAGRLADYRAYVVNHEVGHTLGRSHAGCPGRGLPAPVMMQQTKGVGGCLAQPWPHP